VGKVIRPAEIVHGPPIDEVIGIAETVDPDIIALVWRDCDAKTVAFQLSRAEAIRLTRMLLHKLGPQEPFPDEIATENIVHRRRKR